MFRRAGLTESSCISVASCSLDRGQSLAASIIRANFLTYSHSRSCDEKPRYNYPRDTMIHYAFLLCFDVFPVFFPKHRATLPHRIAIRYAARTSGQFAAVVYWCFPARALHALVSKREISKRLHWWLLCERDCACACVLSEITEPVWFWSTILAFSWKYWASKYPSGSDKD